MHKQSIEHLGSRTYRVTTLCDFLFPYEMKRHPLCVIQVPTDCDHYLIKRTESPALSLFEPTNKLQPVVRRCLFG